MRRLYLLFLVLVLSLTTLSQTPHLSGTVFLSVKKGTISCDLTLSNMPPIENYTLWLNTGFNIASIEDSVQKIKYRWEKSYNNKSEEAFQYQLTYKDDTVKLLPKTLRFQYIGAFPVYADTAKMYDGGDWKGNIAFDGQTLRMTEQSAWYPVIYDKKKDIILNKYTYSIHVLCEDGTSIYLNGDTPKTVGQKWFSSRIPVALMLFAGNYTFKQQAGIYFINSDLDTEETSLLSSWSNDIIGFYSQKLQIPYGSQIFYLAAKPVSKNNVWLFVTYPIIATVGRTFTMHDLFKPTLPKVIDSSNIAFIAHELGHYYFGTLLSPNSELQWAFLEGFTEYLSLQFVKEKLGTAAYQKMVTRYILAVNKAKSITPLNRVNDKNEATETFKYRYVPLLLIALEKNIGQEKMWKWLQNVLQTKDATTNYAFFKSSLLNAGVDAQIFQLFEDKFLNSDQALKNITETVRP